MACDDIAFFKRCRCAECGCEFVAEDPDKWVYKEICKNGRKMFCTWSCLCARRRKRGSKPISHDYADKRYCRIFTDIRLYFSLTLEDCARWLGVSPKTVGTYNGAQPIPPARLKRLAEGLGCRPEDILADRFEPDVAAQWHCIIPSTGQRRGRKQKK